MGILYAVHPLDADMKAWLTSIGVGHPNAPSRRPTGPDIESALRSLEGFSVEISRDGEGDIYQASIFATPGTDEDWWTLLNVDTDRASPEPGRLWFEKGDPELIIAILRHLSSRTGPLVLLADCGGPPLVVGYHERFDVLVWRMTACRVDARKWARLLQAAPGTRDAP